MAISFANEFKDIREKAIIPAIEEDLDPSMPFKAVCLNVSKISGSIHHQILDGIAHSMVVFTDISTMKTKPWKGQRNGNVMFELGIAQAVRPTSDLVVVRSDRESLTFDINHIRVHSYSRGDLSGARRLFAKLLRDSLGQREDAKSLRASFLRDRTDVDSMNLMVKISDDGKNFEPFTISSKGLNDQEKQTTIRLLDLGIIRCVTPEVSPPRREYHYECTDFGRYCYNKPNRS